IEESKDLASLSLDELIENLKVHEMIINKDFEIVKAKGERKSLALKAKKESSDEEFFTFGSKDEEYTMTVRDFKKFFKRKGRFVRKPQNDKKTFQISRDDKNDEEESIRETKKKNLENVFDDETLEIDEIINIKESRNHPIENFIGNLNQRTLRLDIMFSVYLCAHFQEAPKTFHLEAVKRIFQYIKATTHLGLWYPKGTGIETVVYADSDHTGDYVDRKSTSVYEMVLDNDGVASKTTKEKVKSLALKAKVTKDQTSDDSDNQRGSDEDIDEEEAEAFNLLAKNICKFFRKSNQFGRDNRFGKRANRFGKRR
nr:copia protein [Tanacetum cinerariifolium]